MKRSYDDYFKSAFTLSRKQGLSVPASIMKARTLAQTEVDSRNQRSRKRARKIVDACRVKEWWT